MKLLHRALLLVGFSCLASPPVLAEPAPPVTVSSISGYLLTVRFSRTSVTYGEGEGICIYRNRKAVACGHVMSADDSSVEIRLTRGSNRFVPNEKLLVRSSPKYSKAGGGGGSSRSGGGGGKTFQVALGTTLYGPSSVFFAGHMTLGYQVSDNIVLGIQPFYTTSGAELSSLGAYALFNYYFDKAPQGLYLPVGLGLFSIKGRAVDLLNQVIEESATSITARGGLGYRTTFGGSWHAGFELGLQYLGTTQGAQLNFGYNKLNGYLLAEIGLLF